ncbi:MAG: hypothetical protein ACRD3S_03105, partial [Terracidiphilus sp.]
MILRMKLRPILFASVAVCAGYSMAVPSFAQAPSAAKSTAVTTAEVPFVGCASDGQIGPLKAPTDKSMPVSIPA